jgi:hypothetical protein
LGPILGLDTGRKKNCWPFVLDILDDDKCSENFLAPTIIMIPNYDPYGGIYHMVYIDISIYIPWYLACRIQASGGLERRFDGCSKYLTSICVAEPLCLWVLSRSRKSKLDSNALSDGRKN